MPTAPAASERYQDWLPLQISLLSCYRGRPGVLSARMVPRGLTAWLVYRGWGEVAIGNEVIRARPGHWLLPRPVARLQRFSGDIELLSLNFYAQWPTGEPLFNQGLGILVESRKYPELERTSLAINRQFDRVVPGHSYAVFTQPMRFPDYLGIDQQFREFFIAYVQVLESRGIRPSLPGKVDPRLMAAIDQIERLPVSRPLRLQEIAPSAGLGTVQLNRLAIEHLGHTLREHHERRRAEHARRYLSTPGMEVKQVAIELGFTNLAHFSRWFRAAHGVSPRQFRAAGRGAWL